MKIAVIGIGNILMGDEGLGIAVVEELKKRELPKGVEVHDCATLGLQILNFFKDYDFLIVVDVVKSNGKPGDVYVLDFDQCEDYGIPVSLHDIDFVKAFKIGSLVYEIPKIIIVGVEPERIEFGIGLSESVKRAIPKVIDKVVELINRIVKGDMPR